MADPRYIRAHFVPACVARARTGIKGTLLSHTDVGRYMYLASHLINKCVIVWGNKTKCVSSSLRALASSAPYAHMPTSHMHVIGRAGASPLSADGALL